jgi:pimeloyl-ACP methyl ester carboxylesterase
MKTICFTGWQQPHDGLKSIAPDALHFNYTNCRSLAEIIDKFANIDTEYDRIVTWSLGSQIALKLLDDGVLKAKELVMLAPPWQIIQSPEVLDATPPHVLDETISRYKKDPEAVIEHFQSLVFLGAINQKEVLREALGDLPAIWPEGMAWLKFLKSFSCRKLHFNDMPKRIRIFHGDADVIVPVTQVEYFREKLPQAEIFILEGCSHAPQEYVRLER